MTPLRIGILGCSNTIPYWVENVLQFIEKTSCLDLCLVIHDQSSPVVEGSPVRTKLKWSNFLYRVYSQWEMNRVSASLTMAKRVPLASRTKGVGTIAVNPFVTESTGGCSQDGMDEIRSYELDVLINFGCEIPTVEILRSARFGVWSLCLGDDDLDRGGPAGFWEVFENVSQSGVTLRVLCASPETRRYQGKSLVQTDHGSFLRNRDNLFAAGIRLVEDALLLIVNWRGSRKQFFEKFTHESQNCTRRPYREPSNWEMMRFLVQSLLFRLFQKLVTTPTTEIWTIGFSHSVKGKLPPAIEEPKWIEPEPGRFLADPFLAAHDGRDFVFYEDYVFDQGKGKICVAEIYKDLALGPPQIALETEFHLSFPMVFQYHQEFLMLPEQSQSGRLSLYRTEHFPVGWQECHVIFDDLHCVDSILFSHNKRWWLFLTKTYGNVNQNNLYLYSAPSPFGEFEPHPQNPIHSGLRGSRMAGCLFQHEKRLIRPGQDCSESYGGGIVFYEVLELEPDSYLETEIARAGPIAAGGYSEKFHTYNIGEGIAAFDGSRYEQLKAR